MTSAWRGDRVRLRGVEPEDWQAFMGFDEFSDDVRQAWLLPPPRSAEAYRRWAAEVAARDPRLDEFRLAVESLDEQALVGGINTAHPDPGNGTFGYGVAIGRPYQRRGYASEAVVLLLRYMFGERRYQKCNVELYAPNIGSLALHARLGFVEEGRRRRSQYFAGGYHDMVLLGMTIEEFDQLHGLGTAHEMRPR
ncbi:MAG: GNAT family N-acetyltransferase [Streptosporangiales bacterium]|nr:GNAT family N-acetyltransferase [Streptosporangiales bacterium]